MKDDIDRVMRDLRHNIIPLLSLPPLLTEGDQDPPDKGKAKTKAKSDPGPEAQNKPPQWWSRNPGVEPAWALPPGKLMGAFFNSSNETGKENILRFQSVAHHNPKVTPNKKALCIKYHAVGKCQAGCPQAHVKAGDMKADFRRATGEAFKKAYAA
jgi:hypothetical protein